MPPEQPPRVRPWPAALLSLIIPGSGQFLLGERSRGAGLFLTFFLLLVLVRPRLSLYSRDALWSGAALGIAIAVFIYMIYVLIKPEKF